MTGRSLSPKRRHILASINRETEQNDQNERIEGSRKRRARASSEDEQPVTKESVETVDVDERVKRGRLRLKDHNKRRRRRSSRNGSDAHSPSRRDRSHRRDRRPRGDDNEGHEDDDLRRRHHHHRHRHHHHRHRHRSPTPPNPHEDPLLDTETAFRESLFDALADEEGADYWQNVYGQPIHTYSDEYVGPGGELERMTEEEYAAYVRQKMWEKTNQGLIEERERRAEARKRREADEEAKRKLEKEVERSLRVGTERRLRKQEAQAWADYVQKWASWDGSIETLPWPDLTPIGEERSFTEENIKAFFRKGLSPTDDDAQAVAKAYAQRLKDERVRWHPDKIQQRLGGEVDERVMRDVTTIFQILDKLWNEVRTKVQVGT